MVSVKKKLRACLSFIMIFLFTVSFLNVFGISAKAADTALLNKVNKAIALTHNYTVKNGTSSGDWKTVAFNKSELKLPDNYNKNYLEGVAKLLKDSKGYFMKVTDYERITLGVVSAGGDPKNIGGYNLLSKIYNFSDPNYPKRKIDFQGLNGVIYGLIALDSKNYEVPKDAKYTRDYMLDYVLDNENSDGGWDLNMNGSKSDVDITSMTLISLAPYHDYVSKKGKKVKESIDKAAKWLSSVETKDGGFNSWFTENNSESCAQTIIGLCANGIDPAGPEFTKDKNIVENILKFQQSDGQFYHLMDGSSGVNGMSTEQAYQALIAYRDFAGGKGSIYQFNDKKPVAPKSVNVSPASSANMSVINSSSNKIIATVASAAVSDSTQNVTTSSGISGNIIVVAGDEKVQKIYGRDRFETSLNVADKIKLLNGNEKFKNVIISSGYNFPDSLSGSVLAKKLNAPILLTGKSEAENKSIINYVHENVSADGGIYILGGTAAVGSGIQDSLKNIGYKNIKRLSGKNRYDTCDLIFNELNVSTGTPMVIVNESSFADALSISSPASIKGYPIFLSGSSNLPDNIKNRIKTVKPSDVYIIGGEGALSKNIEKEISKLNSSTKITRLSGKNRYDTSLKINQFFNLNESVVLATGENYPDALSGCVLAADLNGSILLVNDNTFNGQLKFIDKDKTDSIIILGGIKVISSKVENATKKLLGLN